MGFIVENKPILLQTFTIIHSNKIYLRKYKVVKNALCNFEILKTKIARNFYAFLETKIALLGVIKSMRKTKV